MGGYVSWLKQWSNQIKLLLPGLWLCPPKNKQLAALGCHIWRHSMGTSEKCSEGGDTRKALPGSLSRLLWKQMLGSSRTRKRTELITVEKLSLKSSEETESHWTKMLIELCSDDGQHNVHSPVYQGAIHMQSPAQKSAPNST